MHNSVKTYDILIKQKVLESLWSAFVWNCDEGGGEIFICKPQQIYHDFIFKSK